MLLNKSKKIQAGFHTCYILLIIFRFELNTSVEYPHNCSVKKVLFQPSSNETNLKCVTIGDDKFKIWQLQEIITPYSK